MSKWAKDNTVVERMAQQYGKDPNGDLIPLLVDENGNSLVKVTGSTVELIALERDVYTNGTGSNIVIPKFANNAFVLLKIYGITGTFESGEGVRLETGFVNNGGTYGQRIGRMNSNYSTSINPGGALHGVLYESGAVENYDENQGGNQLRVAGFFIPSFDKMRLRVGLGISGEFVEDEGVDCEIIVTFGG